MSPQARRALRIDDPVGGDACHVAQPGSPDGSSRRLSDIALSEIHPNPSQPRERFDDVSLLALADSIRERGVLQLVIVQPRTVGGYELIVGERRWRASQIAGIATIPALVAQPVDPGQSIELALIENVAREDLGVIEEARTIAALVNELDVTAATLARRLGRSRSDLAHTIRLLDLPDEAIDLIDAESSQRATASDSPSLSVEIHSSYSCHLSRPVVHALDKSWCDRDAAGAPRPAPKGPVNRQDGPGNAGGDHDGSVALVVQNWEEVAHALPDLVRREGRADDPIHARGVRLQPAE
jgi:ParB/RepB/Spo0J family partition protein